MNKTADALERVRNDARKLHEKIAAASTKNDAALRKDLQDAGEKAQHLASSLRTMAKEQQSEVAAHVANAAASFESAAAAAKVNAQAGAAKLREHHQAAFAHVRSALKSISTATSAKRSAIAKPV